MTLDNGLEAEADSGLVTIALVDDHQMFSEALSVAIRRETDLAVVGMAHNCATARQLIPRVRPNVLLLDVSLPDGDGLDMVPEFKRLHPDIYILVLTSLNDEKTLTRAIDVGVSGFVGKNRPLSEVLAAVRQAAEGEIVMPSSLLIGLLARTSQRRTQPGTPAENWEALTPRERELLQFLAAGKSSRSISNELNISHLTVRTHIRNLLAKLGAHSRLEAVTFALRRGLIEPPA